MTSFLEVRNISKSYSVDGKNSLGVLDNICFEVEEGEFISVVGPSGCGKSTLLQIIAGLLAPDAGRVLLMNSEIIKPRPDLITMMFQETGLFPWRTAISNIEFPLELKKIPKNERTKKAQKYLSLVGMENFGGYYPSQLSGGMQQRINIARALVTEPKLLLMDEPFGALDEITRLEMGNELIKIWSKTRTTILLVTHSLLEAAFLSDRLIVLSGRPAKLVKIINVDVDRPRKIEDDRLRDIREEVWEMIARVNRNDGTA